MAMRRRFGGAGFRRRRARNRPRWCADLVNLNPAAGALASNTVIDETTFGTSTTLESECLLHRVILSGLVSPAVLGASTLALGLVVRNEAAGPVFGGRLDPNNVDSLTDDDWLFTRDVSVVEAPGTGNWAELCRVYQDIRVKRKLKSTDVVDLILSNNAGGVAVTSTFMLRMLVTPRL